MSESSVNPALVVTNKQYAVSYGSSSVSERVCESKLSIQITLKAKHQQEAFREEMIFTFI
jgi:hypothetical protein